MVRQEEDDLIYGSSLVAMMVWSECANLHELVDPKVQGPCLK